MERFLLKLFKICILTIAGIIGLFIIFVINGAIVNRDKLETTSEVAAPESPRHRRPRHPEPPDKVDCPHGDKHHAWSFFQRAAMERMHNPKSADFPWAGFRHLRKTGQCTWTVHSWVEGTNVFGGTIRQKFTGSLELIDRGARIHSLTFE